MIEESKTKISVEMITDDRKEDLINVNDIIPFIETLAFICEQESAKKHFGDLEPNLK